MRNFTKKEMLRIAEFWADGSIVFAHKTTPLIYPLPQVVQFCTYAVQKKLSAHHYTISSEFIVLECSWDVYCAAFDLFKKNLWEQDLLELKQEWDYATEGKQIHLFDQAVERKGFSKIWYNCRMQTFSYFIDLMLLPFNTAYLRWQ